MKHAQIVCWPGLAHHRFWGEAFGTGLKRHGWQVEYVTRRAGRCDLVVAWGTRRSGAFADQKANGGEVCILEHGYLGDRKKWTSVSFGGELNGRGVFRGPFDDASRFEQNFGHLMQPWRRRDGYVLILGQVPTDMSVKGADVIGFYWRAALALKEQGVEFRFRPHPHAPQIRIGDHPNAGGSLAHALEGAAWTVAWNSNSSVDAVMAGVPSVAMDEGSMAWPVTGHAVDQEPPMPDREAWASRLAWCQFTRDEMQSGFCWDMVKP